MNASANSLYNPFLHVATVLTESFAKLRKTCEVFHFTRIGTEVDKGFSNRAACIDTIFVVIGAERAPSVVLGHHVGTPGIVVLPAKPLGRVGLGAD